jgi:hypothetical protein
MKPTNDRKSPRPPAGSPTPRPRFRIEKLEERIAPKKGNGVGLSKNCPKPSLDTLCCPY